MIDLSALVERMQRAWQRALDDALSDVVAAGCPDPAIIRGSDPFLVEIWIGVLPVRPLTGRCIYRQRGVISASTWTVTGEWIAGSPPG